MSEKNHEDDTLVFAAEDATDDNDVQSPWFVLIVDDEPDVHDSTLVALKKQTVLGRPISFLHAYSAKEARTLLEERRDIAVIILDVVMETNDAGLQLVRHIRDELNNRAIRILLRTGQPGYAPEIETIRCHDINDYEAKSALTRTRLFTSLTVALRAYDQIQKLESNRHGLELVIAASNHLSRPRGLHQLAEGIVTQLCSLLGTSEEGLVCAVSKTPGAAPYVLAAAGRFSAWIGKSLACIPDQRVRQEIERSFAERCNRFGDGTQLFITTSSDVELSIYIDAGEPISDVDRFLVELFCTNLVTALENTQLYSRISALAFEDSTLNLPNRNGFAKRFEQRPLSDNTLAIVDIDGFADINTALDQSFGDAVLKAVSDRLQKTFPASIVIARIGSDVFGLLGPDSVLASEKITAAFATPFDLNGQTLRVSATSGIFHIDGPGRSFTDCLRNATVALKHAKVFYRGAALCHDDRLAREAHERMEMLRRLRRAFSTDRLFLVYQPMVDLATGRIVGAEALLHWQDEAGDLIPAANFMPLAEQSGLMVAIGNWAASDSFRFLRSVLDAGFRNFRLAINVSLVQFREPDFADRLATAIKDHGIGAYNIEIELTESVAIDHIDLIRQKIVALQAMGVSITIDGFGTGYSSLNVLRQLNVDCLKIDRSFVCSAPAENRNCGVSQMVLQLSRQLGLRTTAEGIETEEQSVRLLRMGCLNGQGDFYARAMTGQQLMALLANKHNLP